MSKEVFHQIIAVATSAGTLTAMWLTGKKMWQGWAVGLANQVVWLTFIVVFKAWGLFPLFVCLVFVYSKNLVRWRREEHAERWNDQEYRADERFPV